MAFVPTNFIRFSGVLSPLKTHAAMTKCVGFPVPRLIDTQRRRAVFCAKAELPATIDANATSFEVKQERAQHAPALWHATLQMVAAYLKRHVVNISCALLALAAFKAFFPVSSAFAAAAAQVASDQHASKFSHKITTFFRQTTALPDPLVLILVSALPVVELRGGIPIGIFLMKMQPLAVFLLCVLGNFLPCIPLLLLLRKTAAIRTVFKPFLNRAQASTESLHNLSPKLLPSALAFFIAVPIPGTGAWTGTFGAYLLNMPLLEAFAAILAGVSMAGFIVTLLCLIGKQGGIIAMLACALALLVFALASNRKTDTGEGKQKDSSE